MNAAVRIVVTSLVALALWMLGAGISAAHTALSSSDPALNATVGSPPTAITLTFTEDINPTFVNVVLNSEDGRNWASSNPQVDGPRVSAKVQPGLPATGIFTVAYRVVSADGHPVSGSYTFTIVGIAGEPPPAPSSVEATPSTTAAPSAAAPAGADTKTTVITAAVAGLALGGMIAFWQSRKHRRKDTAPFETPPADPPAPDDETGPR